MHDLLINIRKPFARHVKSMFFIIVILFLLFLYFYTKEPEINSGEDDVSFCLRNSIDLDYASHDDYTKVQRSGKLLTRFIQYHSRQFHSIRLHFGYHLEIALSRPLRIELSPGRSGASIFN
jgi:hypothetical protein